MLFLLTVPQIRIFKQGGWAACKPAQWKTMTSAFPTFGQQFKVIAKNQQKKDFVFVFFSVIKTMLLHRLVVQLLPTEWTEMSVDVDYWARPACFKLDTLILATECTLFFISWLLYTSPTVDSGQNLDVPLTSGKNIILASFLPTGWVPNGAIRSLKQMECSTYEQYYGEVGDCVGAGKITQLGVIHKVKNYHCFVCFSVRKKNLIEHLHHWHLKNSSCAIDVVITSFEREFHQRHRGLWSINRHWRAGPYIYRRSVWVSAAAESTFLIAPGWKSSESVTN